MHFPRLCSLAHVSTGPLRLAPPVQHVVPPVHSGTNGFHPLLHAYCCLLRHPESARPPDTSEQVLAVAVKQTEADGRRLKTRGTAPHCGQHGTQARTTYGTHSRGNARHLYCQVAVTAGARNPMSFCPKHTLPQQQQRTICSIYHSHNKCSKAWRLSHHEAAYHDRFCKNSDPAHQHI